MHPDESTHLALLEFSAASLDITPTQREQVEKSYTAVGEALDGSETLRGLKPVISPQGSFLLGTVVKPSPDAVFDIDGTCWLPYNHIYTRSETVYSVVYDALAAHGVYGKMIKQKNRCVRVEYADNFHLDMTPCVTNQSRKHAIYVPDRELRTWKPSNPKLYAELFEGAAKEYPRILSDMVALSNAEKSARARIEPIPAEEGFKKKLLKRLVQMFKRHRDMHFENRKGAVISIIVTTLAAKSYAKLVNQGSYPTLLDFVIKVVDEMPDHITIRDWNGKMEFEILNPAVDGENFAEKWNDDISLATAFDDWQSTLLGELKAYRESLFLNQGTKYLVEKASRIYGARPVQLAANSLAESVARSHRQSEIRITPALGIGALGVTARPTAYYGR